MTKKDGGSWCCWSSKGFPTFAVIFLVIGVLWLLSDLNVIPSDVPWLPVILIIISIGWLADRYIKK